MKSESKEIEVSEVEQEIFLNATVEDVVEVRKWSVMTAMEYWSNRVEASQENGDPVAYPIHIQQILDTASYIEKFLMGDFKYE